MLQEALNTLVMTNTFIPLPITRTQELLKEAERPSEIDRKEDDNKRLNELLTEARTRLEFAQALGYGTKQDCKDLYVQLDEIRDKTSGGKSGAGFFAKITASLSALLKLDQPASGNPAKPVDSKNTGH